MEGRLFNEININSEGYIYLNNNLQAAGIKAALLAHFNTRTQSILLEAEACRQDHCLSKVEAAFRLLQERKQQVKAEVSTEE